MLGDKIKALRINCNMTQLQLAKKLGVASSTIGMYEQNRNKPDIQTLLKLSEIFHVSTDYLLDNEASYNKEVINELEDYDKQMLDNINKNKYLRLLLYSAQKVDNKNLKLIYEIIKQLEIK